MSASELKAVFLSYAAQDAEYARRMAGALRLAGIDVWLGLGQAAEDKLRAQIAACGLFLPLISANSQARLDGHFRLEWKLAAEHARALPEGQSFLLPILIDATLLPTARVPAEFKAVPATRLLEGDASPAFCARVKRLLAQPASGRAADDSDPAARAEMTARRGAQRRARRRWWWLAAFLIFAGGATWFGLSRRAEPAKNPLPVAAPQDAADEVAAQASALAAEAQRLVEAPGDTPGATELRRAAALCEEALARSPADPEILATAAFVSQQLYVFAHDRSPQRLDLARAHAARAVKLAPDNLRAQLAVATGEAAAGNTEEAARQLRRLAPLVATVPALRQTATRAEQLTATAKRHPPKSVSGPLQKKSGSAAPLAMTDPGKTNRAPTPARAEESVAPSPAASAGASAGAGAAGVSAPRETPELPPEKRPRARELTPPGAKETAALAPAARAMAATNYWLGCGDGDQALAALAGVTDEALAAAGAAEPKGVPAGWAHHLAGRPAEARAAWREALQVVGQWQQQRPTDGALLAVQAELQALLGDEAGALISWRRRLEQAGDPRAVPLTEEVALHAALGETAAAVQVLLARWETLARPDRTAQLAAWRFAPRFAGIREDERVQALIEEHLFALRTDPAAAVAGATLASTRPAGRARAAEAGTDEGATAVIAAVAVLPWVSLSEAAAEDYLADGVSMELTDTLGRSPELQVTAVASAYYFQTRPVPLSEIGRQLEVDHAVLGSVRRSGERVRLSGRVVRVADGVVVWRGTVAGEAGAVGELQEALAQRVAGALTATLPARRRATQTGAESSAQKMEWAARLVWEKRATGESEFTPAAAMRSARTQALAVWFAAESAERAGGAGAFGERGGATVARLQALAAEARARDPAAPEALAAEARVHLLAWEFAEAETKLRAALAVNPSFAIAHAWLARAVLSQGRIEEAVVLARRAARLDPLTAERWTELAQLAEFAGRRAQAEFYEARARELTGESGARAWRVGALAAMGETARVAARVESQDVGRWLFDPAWAAARETPAGRELTLQLGLTEAHARAQAWRAGDPTALRR